MPYKRPMTKQGNLPWYEYVYDEYYDCVLCPNYQVLSYSTTNRDGYREYKSRADICRNCPNLERCTASANCVKTVALHLWKDYIEQAEDIRHSDLCKKTYEMDNETPSYHCFGDFINEELTDGIEEIFKTVMAYIQEKDHVDMQHVYIDGTKLEAEINEEIVCTGVHIETGEEYTPEHLQELAERYTGMVGIDCQQFKHGRGHHKSVQQRHYEKLVVYAKKLSEYVEKLRVCGTERNSYS